MKKETKSSKIIAYRKANPNANYAEISKATGATVGLVGVVLSKAKLTNKTVAKKKVTKKATKKPTRGQQILREHIKKDAEYTNGEIHRLNVEVFTLRQQINGFVAVVSYLENKLGIGAENGSAV